MQNIVPIDSLTAGKCKSCGCLQKEKNIDNAKHIVKNRIRHNWSIDKILNTSIINKTIENIKIK